MSEIKVNSIKGVAASTAALTINNTDGTCTANLTNRTNKNLIINGAMNVAQRSASSTANGYGSVDRFAVYNQSTNEAPTQEQADVASGTTPYTLGFRKAIKVTNGNQTAGAGGNDLVAIDYTIEAQDIANSGWNYNSASSYITVSFWIKSSVAQNFKCYLRSMDGNQQQYPFETGSLSADTWTKITKTIPGHANLTFNNDNGQGFQINILAFYGTGGTDNSVTENAWGAYSATARMKDNTSTWYTTNDATLEITGLQLEVGSVATDFEHRSYAQELALCQRYFYKPDVNTNLQPAYQYRHENKMTLVEFPTTMRATPTCTATWNTTDLGFTHYNSSTSHFKAYNNSPYDSTSSYYLETFQASAEL